MTSGDQNTGINVCLFAQHGNDGLAYVYRVPPAGTSGHRAETWNVNQWLAEVRVQVFRDASDHGYIRLEDPEKSELWAECPVTLPLHTCVERVIDSSRYFVIRVVDRDSGNHAFIGLGFREREPASDFYACLLDHQSYLERKHRAEEMSEKARDEQKQGFESRMSGSNSGVDLSLKPGQTMQLTLQANHGGGFVSKGKQRHGQLAKTFSLMFDPHGGMEAALAPSTSSGSSPRQGVTASPGVSYSTEEEWGAFESPH